MKFETFDKRYQVCFTEKQYFKDFNIFVNQYKDFRISLFSDHEILRQQRFDSGTGYFKQDDQDFRDSN